MTTDRPNDEGAAADAGASRRPPQSGILLLDKPAGPTSHDLVRTVRRALHMRRVGHAGTLDPMATGLMVVGVGAATRLLGYFLGADKRYSTTIRLGIGTSTEDAQGGVVARADPAAIARIDRERVESGSRALTGRIQQVPSAVSAIKVAGVHAYDRVRRGEPVELEARDVVIHAFDVLGIQRAEVSGTPVIDVEADIECSSGTYVRALGRDLGAALGVPAHLVRLRRERIGGIDVARAIAPDSPALARSIIDPAAAIVTVLPRLELDATQASSLRHGRRVRVERSRIVAAGTASGRSADPAARDVARGEDAIAAIGPEGHLVGIVAVEDSLTRILMNMPDSEVSAP